MLMQYMGLQFHDYNQRASAQSIHQQQRAEQQNGQLAQMPIMVHEYLTHWGAETSMKCAAAGNRGAPGAQGATEAGWGAAQVTPADLAGIVGQPSKKQGGESMRRTRAVQSTSAWLLGQRWGGSSYLSPQTQPTQSSSYCSSDKKG